MLSIILYSDDAVIAMIEGSAYFLRSFPMLAVQRSVGDVAVSAIFLLRLFDYFDFKYEGSIWRNAAVAIVSVSKVRIEDSDSLCSGGTVYHVPYSLGESRYDIAAVQGDVSVSFSPFDGSRLVGL